MNYMDAQSLALEMIQIGYRNMVAKYGKSFRVYDQRYGEWMTLADLREDLRQEANRLKK